MSSRIGDPETDPPLTAPSRPPLPSTSPKAGLRAGSSSSAPSAQRVSVFGLTNSAAALESYFATHQLAHHTPSEIGWIFSLYLFIVFFVGIQIGPIFEAHGGRILVAAGSLLVVLSVLILSWCETYYQIILAFSVLGGFGGALLNPPAYGCIAHYFSRRRGLATGIATASGGVGGIIFPLILQSVLPNLGFPWSCRILAFVVLGIALPANLFLRTRIPPSHEVTRSLGLLVPLTFLILYAGAHGQDPTASYVLPSYLNAASVAGRVLPGFLADCCGRFNVIIITIALCVATVLCIWLPAGHSQPTLMAYAVLFGFASGSNLGLIPVCLGQLCDVRQCGRYYSTAMMVASLGTLSSVPLGGALLRIRCDVSGAVSSTGWVALILFSGLSYAVALVCYVTARVLALGWDPRTIF
ncbi:major facilitator superfamily domain-containing protein [Lasiosphaeria ovina]|uniref:Major facilitator superfamily domain-containing protein n=1 Tax=Lasiosphaeria ovina TaxID=92902 RepID=A0AAE0JVH3_9PEZI|nr:major facilitator superfamily domain-containing protein [Lasiosphaeria ovina]